MSARLSCWLRGHQWGPVERRTYSDIFANVWRLAFCAQCGARRRHLVRVGGDA